MRKLAFHIQKGGTGKTTLSGNCGAFISESKKTILVDTDTQASLSSWFIKDSIKYELVDYLKESASLEDVIIQLRDNLYLLPTISIDGNLKNYIKGELVDNVFVFMGLNDELEKMGFDICIYDLSPTMGLFEERVLMSLDEVIVPLLPEYFSIDGVEVFSSELAKVNKNYRSNVRFEKIACNMINKSFRRHTVYTEQLMSMDYDIYPISQDSKLAEAQMVGETIFEYAPTSRAVPEIRNLSTALMGE